VTNFLQGHDHLRPETYSETALRGLAADAALMFDGLHGPEYPQNTAMLTQGQEQWQTYEVPVDCRYTAAADTDRVYVRTPFDSANLFWTDKFAGAHRYIAAQYVSPEGRTFWYQMAQAEPDGVWEVRDVSEDKPASRAVSGLAAQEELEAGFRRVQEIAGLAAQLRPQVTPWQAPGGDFGRRWQPSGPTGLI
jgi:hypothetical protein